MFITQVLLPQGAWKMYMFLFMYVDVYDEYRYVIYGS